ncbi:lytic transglycosylase domain-containing protein [Herbaspirillum sp. RTI4]|nr:lytic transglycosylase domain-containing protein [Herbaspirillum sp. RTI4]MDY7579652.1 lytic transglycosylase domain-containing protein [Herbaspirillum sp. RTI4]MEA9981867.1 lytic transglycosylase domain-containing protein [Herbaspirillum sp. RTI4]
MLQVATRVYKATHHALTLAGVVALATLAVMFFNPSFADRLMALSPFASEDAQEAPIAVLAPVQSPPLANLMSPPQAPVMDVTTATPTPLSAEERSMMGTPRQQKLVTNWLSKRYRVAGDATDMLVSAAYLTARDIKIDPLLILAVMAIESGFNPFAESPMGAQGLMQVMSKVHHDKFQRLGGIKAALNPVANIQVGALILKEYVTRSGSVEGGLKSYVGAADMQNDGGYGSKVLSEYQRLKEVSNGKNVPLITNAVMLKPRPAAAPVSKEADASAASMHQNALEIAQLTKL